jgi:GH25 family lysozyme M1 (1,4-beta-N-acetylmuramidase)
MRRTCLLLVSLAACGPSQESNLGATEEELTVCARGATVLGIDVSHYDGTINWAGVKRDSFAFAFMKATEGLTYLDPTFATNWAGAGRNGIIRGAYHYFHASDDPIQQADYFISKAGIPQPGDLPLTLDLEDSSFDSLTAAQVSEAALQFMQRLEEKTGRKPIYYTSARVFNTLLGTPAGWGGYPLWVVGWGVTCPNVPSPPWSDWVFWQITDTGSVDGGISGNVDVNRFNGTLADLQAFVNPGVGSDGGTSDGGGSDGGTGDGGGSDGGSSDGGSAYDGGTGAADGGVAGSGADAGIADGGAVMPRAGTGGGCSFEGRGHPAYGVAILAVLLALALLRRRGRAR